jgi:ParB family transcriptional regulator, chromosome partitioning protein
MAKKQSDYLASLLADDNVAIGTPVEASALPLGDGKASSNLAQTPRQSPAPHRASMSLLGRESALARVASGEVRQVTQLLLDPARVRVWAGNARLQKQLSADNCRDLIDSIIAEGGQKVPAVVRRLEGNAEHDYEVIAGTRRHFAINWLRGNSYPDMKFLAVAAEMDDEAAFRLADIENRARKDVSDIERARNYRDALASHYGGHQTRMAERLKISKGWLSKMLKVASLPEDLLSCFPDWQALPLNPAYKLAVEMDDKHWGVVLRGNIPIVLDRQKLAAKHGTNPLDVAEALKRLHAEPEIEKKIGFQPLTLDSELGRPALTLQSANRQGVTLRLHAGSGASEAELTRAFKAALKVLRDQGRELA